MTADTKPVFEIVTPRPVTAARLLTLAADAAAKEAQRHADGARHCLTFAQAQAAQLQAEPSAAQTADDLARMRGACMINLGRAWRSALTAAAAALEAATTASRDAQAAAKLGTQYMLDGDSRDLIAEALASAHAANAALFDCIDTKAHIDALNNEMRAQFPAYAL